MNRLAMLRLGVEIRSVEFALLVVVIALSSATQVAQAASADAMSPALTRALDLLDEMWPLLAMAPAALVVARDREARLLERVPWPRYGAGREVELAVGAALAFVLVGVALVVGALGNVVTSSDLVASGGWLAPTLVATVVSAPAWVAIGAALGDRARTRVGALAAVAFTSVLTLGLEQLSVRADLGAILYATTPEALTQVVLSGTATVPWISSPSVPVVGTAAWALGALFLLWRSGTRAYGTSTWRDRLPRAHPIAVVVACAPLVGVVGPGLLELALPWQLSPRWAVDQATGRTPDAAMHDLFAAARRGDDAGVRHGALDGNVAVAFGRYRNELLAPPDDITVERQTRADVAGVVRLEWTSPVDGEPRDILGCMTRQPTGWKLAYVVDTGVCPGDNRGL